MARLGWILPLLFVVVAVIYAVAGAFGVALLYAALAAGLGLYGWGIKSGVGPWQWFGAGIAGFALVILLWMAFL